MYNPTILLRLTTIVSYTPVTEILGAFRSRLQFLDIKFLELDGGKQDKRLYDFVVFPIITENIHSVMTAIIRDT